MFKYAFVVVAGGVGERTQKTVPKQFVEIHQKPIIIYSLEIFSKIHPDASIVIACHKDYIEYCKMLIQKYLPSSSNISVIEGGKTRFHSVKNGLVFLNQLKFSGIVAVHDAARPCITSRLVQNCLNEAEKHSNAIPVIPMYESIRQITPNGNTMADRSQFVVVQTPQCAMFDTIYKAFQQPYKDLFTDEANVLESFGIPIHLCAGDKNNIKITYPIDFEIASLILKTYSE